MKIRAKLFISYLIVIGVGLLVLMVALSLVAPYNFTRAMNEAMGTSERGQQRGMMSQSSGMMADIVADAEAYFERSLNGAMIPAGLAAIGAASLASWLMSRRVVGPIQDVSRASQRIADGHYDERLTEYTADDELSELIDSFNQMASTLDATEQLRRQLIADVTHELKTPLASIKGYMEGLQDGVIDASPQTFQLVHREADRLDQLVQDLQELSRAEAAQLNIDIQSTSAAEIITSAVDFLRPQYDEKGVGLTVQLPDQPVMVSADFDRIRQVLLNVLGNALMYTPADGSVSVHLTSHDGTAQLTVRDTGVGLAPDDIERIFQRFYRVDRSRARASGGSGIGLTIARHIVEEHGGAILAESDGLGQGSKFIIKLPVV